MQGTGPECDDVGNGTLDNVNDAIGYFSVMNEIQSGLGTCINVIYWDPP